MPSVPLFFFGKIIILSEILNTNHLFCFTTFFLWVEDCVASLGALLITAACGDVVERVKSVYDQLSLMSSAGHPSHQAVSLFILLFFFYKKQEKDTKKKKLSRKKETEQKRF